MLNSERTPLFTTYLQNKEFKRLQANKLNIFPSLSFDVAELNINIMIIEIIIRKMNK